MSAQPVEETVVEAGASDRHRHPGGEAAAPAPVEVRRHALVSVLVGATAAGVGIAYLWRAAGSGAVFDWVLCLVMGAVAAAFLRSLMDARLPLLVADEMGVRVRLGAQWRGLPWEAVDRVVVTPRRGLLHDGRMVVSLVHVERALEGLDRRAVRHARLNQRLYGGALAVPIGLTTRVPALGGDDLADRVAALSSGRAEVVTLLAEPGPVAKAQPAPGQPAPAQVAPGQPVPGRSVPGSAASVEAGAAEPAASHPLARSFPGPATRPTQAEEQEEEAPSLGRGARVRAIARLGEPVDPLVIEDYEPEPAYDPVIGPELAAARTRVGLSVDELANRTRIRPHVIESIEVDDFAPCGGDFYARGHIRTLARVLGKDPAPLLAEFEARYATAPVNARKVFEAELATGLTGTVRATVGGPNWTLLVGAVLTLVVVWGAVRLLAGGPQEVLEPPPALDRSAGLSAGYGAHRTTPQARPLVTSIAAENAGAHVEVRDVDGDLVYEGDLVVGATRTVRARPPVTVTSDNGGAVRVTVNGRDEGLLGDLDQPATRVFRRAAH